MELERYTTSPVKITMTGPHMLAAVAHDEHYGDIGAFMLDLAGVLNRNFRELQAAGCEHVQVLGPRRPASGSLGARDVNGLLATPGRVT